MTIGEMRARMSHLEFVAWKKWIARTASDGTADANLKGELAELVRRTGGR